MEMEDYLQEFRDITIERSSQYEDPPPVVKTPVEGELEAAWLNDAGFSEFVSSVEAGREVDGGLMEQVLTSLTKSQRAVVRRRVDTINATLQRPYNDLHRPRAQRGGFTGLPHCKDVFNTTTNNTSNYNNDKTTLTSEIPISDVIRRPPPRIRRAPASNHPLPNTGLATVSKDLIPDNQSQGIQILSIVNKHNRDDSILQPVPGAQLSTGIEEDIDIDLSAQFVIDPNSADATLPDVRVADCKFGVNQIADLSLSTDMSTLSTLALIELTTIFDEQGINLVMKRQKSSAKYKMKGQCVFGVSLQQLLEHDSARDPATNVPIFFQKLVSMMCNREYLNQPGIFRVPGSMSRIKAVCTDIDSLYHDTGQCPLDGIQHNDGAAILKKFIRELPEPLLTSHYLQAFLSTDDFSDIKTQLKALNLLVILLPEVHRNTLKVLLLYLNKVIDNETLNKMSLNNIATILAPNLFLTKHQGDTKHCNPWDMKRVAETQCRVVKMLITYHSQLWTVPTGLLQQVRAMNEITIKKFIDLRSVKRLFGGNRGNKEPSKTNYTVEDITAVKIQAPGLLEGVSTTVRITMTTSADALLTRFKHKYALFNNVSQGHTDRNCSICMSGLSVIPELQQWLLSTKQQSCNCLHLFEENGNIGSRCLPPSAIISSVLKINKNADLFIRKIS